MPPPHHPRRYPKLPIRSQLIDGMGVNRPDVSLERCLMWSLSRTRRSRAARSGGFFGPPTLHRGPDEPQYFADHRRRNPLYRNGFRCNYTFGTGTEKAETAYGLNVRRDLDFLFVQQEQLPRADLFGAQIFGRLVKVFGELGDRADVAFHGRRRVVADLEVFQHPLS